MRADGPTPKLTPLERLEYRTAKRQRDRIAALEAENAELWKVVEYIWQVSAAHHAEQPVHVLLHALTVDIPAMCEAAIAAKAKDEQKGGGA